MVISLITLKSDEIRKAATIFMRYFKQYRVLMCTFFWIRPLFSRTPSCTSGYALKTFVSEF